MTLQVTQLINIMADLCESRQLKVTVKHSFKGGVITGISAFIGGLLFGPPGLAVGGLMGGVGASLHSGQFKPVAVVLREMSPEEKQKLYDKIVLAISRLDHVDLLFLGSAILSNMDLQNIAIQEVLNYLSSNSNMQVV